MPRANNSNEYSEKNFAVIDGKTGAVTPTTPKINLSSLDDVRLEMAQGLPRDARQRPWSRAKVRVLCMSCSNSPSYMRLSRLHGALRRWRWLSAAGPSHEDADQDL